MRFSGQYIDEESDLIYYGHRYYKSSTGQWLSRDSLEESGGANLYSFVSNEPIGHQDYLGLTSIGSVLRAFFWPWDKGETLWIMPESDSYTKIVREWGPVRGNMLRLKRAVAANPGKWEQSHITSRDWLPTKSYAPDPKNGWNVLEASPPGTDPETAKKNFITFLLTGYSTDALHTSAIGSFRIIATADRVDVCEGKAKLNIWMYNEMSRRSFGNFAKHPFFKWRSMRSQFMWWNWKEEFEFDSKGNIMDMGNSKQ